MVQKKDPALMELTFYQCCLLCDTKQYCLVKEPTCELYQTQSMFTQGQQDVAKKDRLLGFWVIHQNYKE